MFEVTNQIAEPKTRKQSFPSWLYISQLGAGVDGESNAAEKAGRGGGPDIIPADYSGTVSCLCREASGFVYRLVKLTSLSLTVCMR